MKKKFSSVLLSGVISITGCASNEYSGKGGMTAKSIKPAVYEYHYQHGFTGVDSMGWDPNLQYAWSRAGAAITCKVPMNEKSVLAKMTKEYGQSDFIHKLNGVGYHNLQSEKVIDFCTNERISEIQDFVSKIESGQFPKPF